MVLGKWGISGLLQGLLCLHNLLTLPLSLEPVLGLI